MLKSCSVAVELSGDHATDIATVDALAQLALAAKRLGLELRLADAPKELLELVALTGLGEALRVEPGRQPEEGKQPLGVEEERHLGDPPG